VRRDESLNGAGDVDNTFLQDNDFTLYYVLRRAFVTRLYRNRSPQSRRVPAGTGQLPQKELLPAGEDVPVSSVVSPKVPGAP